MACDCTALAPTLLESELFGHVKGSFSGAIATKQGLFEVAHHGTLFLDEVANLSQETQGKLLRVLETRRVRKVGDTAEHEVDIRLIATTNRSLAEMVKAGEFRADLYYRLNVVPDLAPRRCATGTATSRLLAEAFLEQFSRQMGVEVQGFPLRSHAADGGPLLAGQRPRAAEHRRAAGRALRRFADRAFPPALGDPRGPAVGLCRRGARHLGGVQAAEAAAGRGPGAAVLVGALDRCGQNVTQAAESVGMQRSNFHALLRQLRPSSPMHGGM